MAVPAGSSIVQSRSPTGELRLTICVPDSEAGVLNFLPSNVAVPRPGRMDGRRVLVVKTERHDDAFAGPSPEATMSLLFAREGARVAIADADERVVMETVDRIRSDGGDAYTIGADLAFEADAGWMMREACKALGGRLDGLVLNAAGGRNVEPHQLDAQEWTRIFDLNVRGPMLCCREALSNFRDGGSVVFTASMDGPGASRKRMAYDLVGAAIVGLMRNVAAEGASRSIRANLVYSGPQCALPRFGLDAYAHFDQDRMAPGNRAAAAAIANAALFFLSDESAGVTAQILTVMHGHDPLSVAG